MTGLEVQASLGYIGEGREGGRGNMTGLEVQASLGYIGEGRREREEI